jgi:hypothetical protein
MIELTATAELSYKIGMDEVVGLEDCLRGLMAPIRRALKAKMYWSQVDIDSVEYKSRDGFSAHSHNCGGLMIREVIPKCEEYDFAFLEFGELTECCLAEPEDEESCGSTCEGEGHYDAQLRIWFKFEGINDEGEMEFYLFVGGGNGDAPYFRSKHETDILEFSFTAKSLDQLRRRASKPIEQVIRLIKAGK